MQAIPRVHASTLPPLPPQFEAVAGTWPITEFEKIGEAAASHRGSGTDWSHETDGVDRPKLPRALGPWPSLVFFQRRQAALLASSAKHSSRAAQDVRVRKGENGSCGFYER